MATNDQTAKTKIDSKTIISLLVLLGAFYLIWPFFQNKLIERPVPNSTLQSMQGNVIDLSAKDKPSILFFWATWCEICKVQMPDMLDLEDQYDVVYISADSGSDNKVLAEATKHGLTSENLVNDSAGLIKDAFKVAGYPSLAVVKNNQIRFFKVGYMRKKEIESVLEEFK